MIENRMYVLVSFAAILIALGYGISILEEPKMADGALEFSEANIFEIIVFMFAVIAGVTIWIQAIFHSFKNMRKVWCITTIFVWPAAFVYAVMVNYVWKSRQLL